MSLNLSRKILLIGTICTLLIGCASSGQQSPFIDAEPEVGSIQVRSPRTLRLYFEALPDVPRSSVELYGPNGILTLRGLHTMGANDLMMEIYDDVVDGTYTVQWSTYFTDQPAEHSGSYSFEVRSN